MMRMPKVTYRQEGGDDGYCYVLRVDGRAVCNGMQRSEAKWRADALKAKYKAEREAAKAAA
jgi:hypothetical protein